MVDNNEFEFREESEYQGEVKYSIKEIILRHLRKIGDICCQEFTGGWWEEKPIRTQSGMMIIKTYHSDVRQSYCNAIDFLIDIIYPMGDKKLQEYLDENEKFNDGDKNEKDIDKKLNQKRKTFRQINIMFQRTNFWQGTESYNE